MKKLTLSLLFMAFALSGMGQTIGDAFYVYRNDGMINTFFRSDVDSIGYSYYDADSLLYDEIVTQVVYTPDSIYQIPLATVDSVSFVTPKTKYKPGVIKLEGTVRDYIIGSDSLTVYFRSDTPSGLLPNIGDKLVTTEMSEVFIAGFAGEVENIEHLTDSIAINCSPIGLDEVFEVFYYNNGGGKDNNNSRCGVDFSTDKYSPGTYRFALNKVLEAYGSVEVFGLSLEGSPGLEFKATPTYSTRGSIIVHPFWGVVLTLDLFCENTFTEELSFSGSLSYSPDLDVDVITIPIPAIPFVQIYGSIGPLFKAELKGCLMEKWSQTIRYHFHYENATNPLFFPVALVSRGENSYTHEGQRTLEGSISGGVRGEIGLKVIDKRLASVGFGFEAGLKLSGDALILPFTDYSNLNSTTLYNKLKKGLDLDFFVNLGLSARLFWCETGVNKTLFEIPVHKFHLVPTFTNTFLSRDPYSPTTLIASTFATNKLVTSVDLGFKLFKGDETEGLGSTTCKYKEGPQDLSIAYTNMTGISSYKLYPTVNLFGVEMLAEPSSEIGIGIAPITLEAENISDSTAKVNGRIEYHQLLDKTVQFGLGWHEVGREGGSKYDASYIDKDGGYSVVFYALKPNTTYRYFSYIVIDGKEIDGEEKEFTTDGICPDAKHPHIIDLGLPSGTLWMCCNYGANAPIDTGDYLAWGETKSKTEYTKDNYVYHHIDKDGTYVYDDVSFDLAPSLEQVEELRSQCKIEPFTMNDIKGDLFIGPNGNKIFVPYSGVKEDSTANFEGEEDHYWTSTLPSDESETRKNSSITRSNNGDDEGKAYDWYDLDWRYLGKTVRQAFYK